MCHNVTITKELIDTDIILSLFACYSVPIIRWFMIPHIFMVLFQQASTIKIQLNGIKNGINPNSNELIACMNSSIIVIYYVSIVLWYLALPISKRTKSEALILSPFRPKNTLIPCVAYWVFGCFLNLSIGMKNRTSLIIQVVCSLLE
jgi:hypothetical protein